MSEEVVALVLFGIVGLAAKLWFGLTAREMRDNLLWSIVTIFAIGGAAGFLWDCWVACGLPIAWNR